MEDTNLDENSSKINPQISNFPYKFAVCHEEMNPRKRHTMEDVHRIVPILTTVGNKTYSYIAVYDGHGGRKIVDFLEENLENNIVKELHANDSASIQERLTRAYLITDMQSKKVQLTTSGATAVSALMESITDETGKVVSKNLYCANVGDSRAVLVCRDSINDSTKSKDSLFIAKRLSFDHRSEDESEQKRIKEAGGFITRNRVLGILAVTRSFGDHGMKEYVSAEPYLSSSDILNLEEYPILILACDGVWDVITDQEAANIVMKKFLEVGPFPEAAEMLVRTALERGSTDNITAIVVFF